MSFCTHRHEGRRGGIALAALVALWLPVLTGVISGAATPASAATSTGGVELDAYGGIWSFGGLSVNTSSAPSWPGWDIARSVSVLPDGSGGWTLDGWGGIHSWGSAPPVNATQYSSDPRARASPYWAGWDIARALVVLPNEQSGYVLDGYGGVWAFGGAPSFSGTPYWKGWDIARGLDIHLGSNGVPDGGAVMDGYGGIHTFGNYPYSLSPTAYPIRDVFQRLHDVGGHVYGVGKFGNVVEETTGSAMTPAWSGYRDWGSTDVLRDIVLVSATGGTGAAQPKSTMARYGWQSALGQRGGAVLDGWGGIHTFGGLALNTARAPSWAGWDIARSMVILPDGSGGWTLDGWGGVHAWGTAHTLAVTQSWPGADAARSLVVNPDGRSGYVLDEYGGIWRFGGAPALSNYPYWSGWDVARGLVIHYTNAGVSDGGWTLDAYGGVHAFGAAPPAASPSYWSGRNVYLQMHETYDGHQYEIGRWGEFAAPGETMSPYWSGYSDWGSWDILRDVVLIGDDDASGPPQPVSEAASQAWWDHVWVFSFNVAPLQQGLPLDCESAALAEAAREKGLSISQYTIFNQLPQEPGSAVWSGASISRWGDPYVAFVGNVYGSEGQGTGYGVYDGPLAQVAINNNMQAVGIESGSPSEIYTYLSMGDPVVIFTSDTYTPVARNYWTAWDGRIVPYALTDHAVTLVGINALAGTITLNDVADGRMKTFTMSQFASFWTAYLDMAVVLT